MNIFDDFTRSAILALNANEVKYLVVGGYAVNFYGYVRTTGDIDMWIMPDNGLNKVNFLKALRETGIEDGVIADLKEMDFSKSHVFSDGEPPYKIDFMTNISGVKFTEAWEGKISTEIDGIPINFINLHHLVLSKISNNRPKDAIDVEELQKIQNLKKKNSPE